MKKTCLFILIMVFSMVTSSCSNSSTTNVLTPTLQPTPMPTPLISWDSFCYDGKITWKSSYSDVQKIYGEPHSVWYNDRGEFECLYGPVSILNFNNFTRIFTFDEYGHLVNISIGLLSQPYKGFNLQIRDRVINGLNELYGTYSRDNRYDDDGNLLDEQHGLDLWEWVWQVEGTYIRFLCSDKYFDLEYRLLNKNYVSQPYFVPTASPIPTANHQGL